MRNLTTNTMIMRKSYMKIAVLKRFVPIMAAAVMLSACSTKNSSDPLETYNRGMFQVNKAVDTVLIRPIAAGYHYITPDGIRSRIGNMSDNLHEPVSMINSFLQGEFTLGMNNFWRFVINSTVGLAGMHDVAGLAGIKPQREDFGQTLAVWGVGSGPYIVLPIFGPSNLRDTAGMAGDWMMDPVTWALQQDGTDWTLYGVRAGQGIVTRERYLDAIDDIYSSSLDPYASFKSIYEQRRAAEIKNRHTDKPEL